MNELRVIPCYLLKLTFRVSDYTYRGIIKSLKGVVRLRYKLWIDCDALKEFLPPSLFNSLNEYSIAIADIGIKRKRIRRPRARERQRLVTLVLTVSEASAITRISVPCLEKAILLGQIKVIRLGGGKFIPRVELERIMGCLIDEEKISRICHLR
jgi:hypothetical protein